MHSRHHGGKGVDPRATAAGAPHQTMSADQLLSAVLLPLFRVPRTQEVDASLAVHVDASLPAYTSFVFNEEECARNMIAQLRQDCPGVGKTREDFLRKMASIYDTLQAEAPVSSLV